MKKALLLFLATAAAAVALFTGCGVKSDSAETDKNSHDTQNETITRSGENANNDDFRFVPRDLEGRPVRYYDNFGFGEIIILNFSKPCRHCKPEKPSEPEEPSLPAQPEEEN